MRKGGQREIKRHRVYAVTQTQTDGGWVGGSYEQMGLLVKVIELKKMKTSVSPQSE